MARARTRDQVHRAVLALVAEEGTRPLTMEGVAARAGVSKQTLYRSWPSTGAIVFDALQARSLGPDGEVEVPDTGDLAADLLTLVRGTVAELTDPTHDRLLRLLTAEIQTDDRLAAEYRERLLGPQLQAVAARFHAADVEDPTAAAELLLGPILHRWLLRTTPFTATWPRSHVARTLRALTPNAG